MRDVFSRLNLTFSKHFCILVSCAQASTSLGKIVPQFNTPWKVHHQPQAVMLLKFDPMETDFPTLSPISKDNNFPSHATAKRSECRANFPTDLIKPVNMVINYLYILKP